MTAMPTAIMAPEINPPGRPVTRNKTPPIEPIASASKA
jgi:hypothetical protein